MAGSRRDHRSDVRVDVHGEGDIDGTHQGEDD